MIRMLLFTKNLQKGGLLLQKFFADLHIIGQKEAKSLVKRGVIK